MIPKKVLIVEDEPDQNSHYQAMIKKLGYQVFPAYSKDEAFEILQKQAIDILITDIHLTNSAERNSFEGFEVLKYAKENSPECLAIAMSNDPKVTTYNQAHELGALSLVKKPICTMDEFNWAILTAREKKDYIQIKEKINGSDLAQAVLDQRCEDGLVLDDSTRETAFLLTQAKELPCIICGESGTGKEEIAKLIHKKRMAAEGPIPFVAVNCANLDAGTAASQLFGHKRGSFTGADATTTGFVGEADGGILFLDEIHALSLDCQRRLLRVLNDGTYQRLGDTKTLRSEFQVIVASIKDIDELVQKGLFIPDLRSRITGVMINLKPLRDRADDISALVPLIFAKIGAKVEYNDMLAIIERCKSFYWQDNIRQLYNTLKATTLICQCKKKSVTAADLQIYPSMLHPNHHSDSTAPLSDISSILIDKGISETLAKEVLMPLAEDLPFTDTMDRYEMYVLKNAVSRHGKISSVVDKLQISRSTLDSKRKKYGMTDE